MADGEPLRYHRPVNTLVRVWLGKQSQREGGKVSPEDEVERMEGVGAPTRMLLVVLSSKLPSGESSTPQSYNRPSRWIVALYWCGGRSERGTKVMNILNSTLYNR